MTQGELDIDEFLMGCYQLLVIVLLGAFVFVLPSYIHLLRLQGDATGWSPNTTGLMANK